MYKLLIIIFVAICTFAEAQSTSTYTEVPFVLSQTGQIIVEAKINDSERPAFFYLETNGRNTLRKDQPQVLDYYNLAIDRGVTDIRKLTIGDLNFAFERFKVKSSLHQRGNIAFPDPILGTIGMELFQNKVIRIDFKNNKFIIAQSLDQFEFSDSTLRVGFRNSFVNKGVYLNIETRQFGENQIAIDTRSPLGVHLYYGDLSLNNKIRFKESFSTINFKLNGEDELPFLYYDPKVVYIEDDLQITNQGAWFSDYLPNCIGNAFLMNFIVTVDFKKNFIYFDPINQEGYNSLSSL